MNLIEFKNLPDTTTPLNAENLNLLQKNVNDEFTTIKGTINGIVESGSNEKGIWAKFADGTLIQYGEVIQSANVDYADIEFPVNFINSNYYVNFISWFQWLRGANFTYGHKEKNKVRTFPNYLDDSGNWIRFTEYTPTICWFAIGNWK